MIITNDEAALRVVCQPVTPDEVGSLVEALEKELEYSNRTGRTGIGLAAPQIGIAKHIAIIRLPKVNLTLANTHLQEGFDPALFEEEGCLSFPGRVEDTIRFQEVHIAGNLVEPHGLIASGLLAVVCQHELDHLNSVLFMDRKKPKPIPIPIVKSTSKIGPNELCPCGSGRKHKRCHGR